MVEVKGTAVRDTVESVRGRSSPEDFERFLASLEAGARVLFLEPINVSAWYPLDDFARLLDADIRELDGGDPQGFMTRAEGVFEKQLKGIYRLFIRLGSPESLVKRIAVAHSAYFRGVDIALLACESGRAEVRYTGFSRRHAVVEYAIRSFYKRGLELSGASQVKVRVVSSIASQAAVCQLELTWA